jgi:lysophospholipase L1-like esterase
MKRTVSRTLVSVLLIASSALLALGAAEGLLRLKNADMRNYDIEMWRYARELKKPSDIPVLGHEHVPSSEAVLESVKVRINADGMRGPEVAPITGDRKRILFLGSSATFGWGVAEDETMSALVEKRLKADGHDVDVLNAGIGNYNAVRYVTLFFERLARFEPDIVVIHYFINDTDILEPGGGNWFLRNSQLAVSLWIAANRLTGAGSFEALVEQYRKSYEPDAEGFRAMKAALTRLAAHARERNIRVILAMLPDIHDVNEYPFGFAHAALRILSGELGFTYVDLLPSLRGLKANDLWVMPGDPHVNARGHRLLADTLVPPLAAMLPPPDRR